MFACREAQSHRGACDCSHRHVVSCSLEEVIFVLLANLIIDIVFIRVSKNFVLQLLGLGLSNLVLLLTLLGLSLDLSLGSLDFFVLQNIACLDDILNGCIIKDVLALLNDLLDEEGGKRNVSAFLLKATEKGQNRQRIGVSNNNHPQDFKYLSDILTFMAVATFLACFKWSFISLRTTLSPACCATLLPPVPPS